MEKKSSMAWYSQFHVQDTEIQFPQNLHNCLGERSKISMTFCVNFQKRTALSGHNGLALLHIWQQFQL
jgi:hypothetical protein